jgi:V8-like Glu-specific endopeptidase
MTGIHLRSSTRSRTWALTLLALLGCGRAADPMAEPVERVSSALRSGGGGAPTHPALAIKRRNPDGYDAPAVLRSLGESICGANDLQFVNAYNGLLGPTTAFVQDHRAAVGAMAASTTDGKFCSGTLVSRDLFLTASHCVGATTVGEVVSFNYERSGGAGSALLTESFFTVDQVVEDNTVLDFALIRLAGAPGSTFPWTAISSAGAANGAAITIIQHPLGEPKQIEAGSVAHQTADYYFYGNVDTQPGSSGSGILDAGGQLVGVHTNGGCTSSGGENSGVRISRALDLSATLSGVAGKVMGVVSGGDVLSGGGVAVADIDGLPGREVILSGVDSWSGLDYWRLSIGKSCQNGACTWSAPIGVESGAASLSSSAVATGDFDGDGRADVLLTGIDNWDGLDYWRLRVGTGCTAAGCTWSPIVGVGSDGDVLSGGGVAVTQLDGDPRPDIVLVGIDNWSGGNDYWRYRIGMNCDAAGQCTWSPVQGVESGGATLSGGGVAIGDLDGNGVPEVVIFGIDNWNGLDYWRYRVGSACNGTTGVCSWSPVQGLESGADKLVGGGVRVADLTGDGRPEVVVTGIDTWGGLDYWRYRVATGCDTAGNCTWTPVRGVSSDGATLVGGGVALDDVDGDGQPDLTLVGIDTWSGLDYWRYRTLRGCTAGPCNGGGGF